VLAADKHASRSGMTGAYRDGERVDRETLLSHLYRTD
jgi:hypothetical protein